MKLDYGIDFQLGHALQPRITACGERSRSMFPFGGPSFKWKIARSSGGLAHSCANYTDEIRYWSFSSFSTGLSYRARTLPVYCTIPLSLQPDRRSGVLQFPQACLFKYLSGSGQFFLHIYRNLIIYIYK